MLEYNKTQSKLIKDYLANIYAKLCRKKPTPDNQMKSKFIFNLYASEELNKDLEK